MIWLKKYPVAVNLLLAFAIALLAGLWTSLYTSSSPQAPMPDRQHLLLMLAAALIGFQCWYGESLGRTEKKIIVELLDLGIRFFAANSHTNVSENELRVIVHIREKTRPGEGLAIQSCLVPRYYKSPVAPRDFGAIPIDSESFKKWYVNVKAFVEQQVICAEPSQNDRPAAEGHFVSTPSLFTAKSVLSAPIWCRKQPHPFVIGTITFDSKHSAIDMNWLNNGVVSDSAKDMLDSLADLIGKILSNDTENS